MEKYTFEFELSNVKYRAVVPENLEHYTLERFDGFSFKKVPCGTDYEEKKYPKSAGYVATAYLHGLRRQTND